MRMHMHIYCVCMYTALKDLSVRQWWARNSADQKARGELESLLGRHRLNG